jgi:hypothetical protein
VKRPLVVLLAANAVSLTGNTLTMLAVPWFVLVTTGSVARIGLAAAVHRPGLEEDQLHRTLIGDPREDTARPELTGQRGQLTRRSARPTVPGPPLCLGQNRWPLTGREP